MNILLKKRRKREKEGRKKIIILRFEFYELGYLSNVRQSCKKKKIKKKYKAAASEIAIPYACV